MKLNIGARLICEGSVVASDRKHWIDEVTAKLTGHDISLENFKVYLSVPELIEVTTLIPATPLQQFKDQYISAWRHGAI